MASLLSQVRFGMAVLDVEHRAIGWVSGLDAGRFQLTTHRGAVSWVHADALFVVDGMTVELICPHDGLDRYRAD